MFANIAVTVLLCIFLLFLWQGFSNVTGVFIPRNRQPLYQFIQATIIVFCLVGCTYKKLWRPSFINSRIKRSGLVSFIFILLILCYHFLSIHKNAVAYYNYISSDNFISWGESMYTKDVNLGYKMIPDRRSALLYKYLQPVDVQTDKNGFRIPVSKKSLTDVSKPIDILFLGCSFTFGSACKAEDTFPYLVASEKQMNYINAAVGGYGLAQMYIQAKQLISKYKPKYLVVQNSPWLIERGVSEFAPSRGGYMLPVPYFADSANFFRAEPPIYTSSIAKLFPAEDRRIFSGNFLLYYFKKGLLYFANEQLHVFITRCKNFLFLKKMPTGKIASAEFYAYKEIFKYAELHQTKIVLLNLCNPPDSDKARKISRIGKKVSIANADSLLNNYIREYSLFNYKRAFGHWGITKSGDSIFVDSHPNTMSHKLIAESICAVIK